MKATTYTCDRCKKIISSTESYSSDFSSALVGGGSLCTLTYGGYMGHNQFPSDGFHYHYECFISVVEAILKANNKRNK